MKELGRDWISTNRKGKYWIRIMNSPESKQMSIHSSWQHRFSELNQITGRHIWQLSRRAYSHHALQILTNLNTWHCWGFPSSTCGDFKEFPQFDATAAAVLCCTHSLLWLKSNMTSRWCTWLLIKPSHLQKYTGWWFKERGYKLAFAQSLLNTQWKIKLYSSFEHVHVCKEADAVGRHKHRFLCCLWDDDDDGGPEQGSMPGKQHGHWLLYKIRKSVTASDATVFIPKLRSTVVLTLVNEKKAAC